VPHPAIRRAKIGGNFGVQYRIDTTRSCPPYI
jgi:hypothetical protein